MNKTYGTIFMGTSEFAVPILKTLATSASLKKAHVEIVEVITTPDTKSGRGLKLTPPPVKIEAEKLGLKIIQPQTLIEKELPKADLIILAAYGKILPSWLIKLPTKGALNIHPSLLPKLRGATPIQTAILEGWEQTGASLFVMDEKIDHGPVIAQVNCPTAENETYTSLEKKLAELGAKLLEESLPNWLEGNITAKTQDDSQATQTRLIKKQDGKIDWSKSAKEIERQIRAFEQWPGSYCVWRMTDDKELTLKITKANPLYQHIKSTHDTGKIMYVNGKIGVVTGDGILMLERVQPAGKKEMSIEEFARGHKNFINSSLN
ncbi:methionyl-tRNA formyltransferase [Candidatus Parcubacteria bacterium]|nr:MAG: methionyl-tRNA formyltransferase [Candidatus Parcubacteria bacterium]